MAEGGPRVTGSPPRAACSQPVVDLEAEIRMVLTAANRLACRRSVDLQMAVEPRLVAETDVAAFRACLREFVADAIGRAEGGVLVTAHKHGQRVDVDVLDDGSMRSNAFAARTVPPGGIVNVSYQAGDGTAMRLSLPYPDDAQGMLK